MCWWAASAISSSARACSALLAGSKEWIGAAIARKICSQRRIQSAKRIGGDSRICHSLSSEDRAPRVTRAGTEDADVESKLSEIAGDDVAEGEEVTPGKALAKREEVSRSSSSDCNLLRFSERGGDMSGEKAL